jgi:hypothetical protein
MPSDGRWSLPRVERGDDTHPYFGVLLDEFREQLGLDLAVLRVAYLPKIPAEGEDGEMVLACENRAPDEKLPAEGRWAERRDLVGLDLAPPEHREVLQEWFDESEGRRALPALRVPWARPGWLAEVDGWIEERLEEQGMFTIGPSAQVKTWSISCVLRVPTTEGSVYFKAVPPLFAGEPELTCQLSWRHPGQVPEVLAHDPERGWLLMREICGIQLRRAPTIHIWSAALAAFARLQIDHAGQPERLLAWGGVDRRIAGLPGQFDRLLEELGSPDLRTIYGISQEDAARVAALVPRVREAIAALATAGVPETLVHGDLHLGNVMTDEGRFVFFDWTDGAVAHPFFDLLTFFRDLPDDLDTPAARERLRDAYLEPWKALLPRERLLAAFDLSQQVAPLYHALSYRYIAANTEPSLQWELSDGVGDYLRLLLAV